jgi:hypothetical protein
MARLTWVLAVAWLIVRAVAMSALLRPWATSPTISFSRVVSWARASLSSRGVVVRLVSRAISRRVSPGERRASPPATTRMPCSS